MEPGAKKKRVKIKAWHVLFLIVVVIITLLLAYWQWTRFTSGTGSLQNLGYAMQWPAFGAFAVFAYRQAVKMENQRIDAENASMEELYAADAAKYGDPSASAASVPPASGGKRDEPMTKISEDFLPSRPTMNVDEFNARFAPRRGHHESD
ncbi:hypothetical protein KIP68_08785 [Corynebacterium aquatimens]|nr:hypothetical protein CAQUA_02530 [Corynebacterium aquatimens]